MIFTGERVIEGVTPQRIWMDHVKRYEFASAYIKNMKRGLTLDIACGTGYGCKILSNKGNIPKIIEVDISREAIGFAHANYKTAGIEFVIGDAINLPFSKEKFDYVVCFETIEHIKTPEKNASRTYKNIKN
jgi:2-polyprenyl-3-methyl-5-hydroxy-6-metoxy-1,4-benzoquinol methylase